jgi:hypothetical protein
MCKLSALLVANLPRSSLREKLTELGVAGILAYGLLNTLYYIIAFLFFYLCVIHPPRGALSSGF